MRWQVSISWVEQNRFGSGFAVRWVRNLLKGNTCFDIKDSLCGQGNWAGEFMLGYEDGVKGAVCWHLSYDPWLPRPCYACINIYPRLHNAAMAECLSGLLLANWVINKIAYTKDGLD